MRTALVTGASKGIGEALAVELSRAEYFVYVAARSLDLLEELTQRIESEGGRAQAVFLDARDGDMVVETIRRIDDECKGLDLIVAGAGVGADRARNPYQWEAVREALSTNFVGAGATLTAVLPQMVERRRGHLVGIGSLASYGAVPGGLAYSAPKAGLGMMLDCLRLDTHGSGVAITEVKLGFVDTAAVEGATHRLPQLQSADHVAKVVVKRLASRPNCIVYPRALGMVARAGAHLPQWSRRMLFSLGKDR